ncbi:MAG TPA: hypothetical protein PKK58_12410, partial [Opitutaceae bacterium]|nr:hypothetical protein [Opitutaceae bacterium]HQL21370.1 hypothetical protein [Opitutaceae bacterium]
RLTVLLALTAFHDLNWDGARGHGVVGSGRRFFEFASGRCGAAVRSPIKIREALKVEPVGRRGFTAVGRKVNGGLFKVQTENGDPQGADNALT